MRTDIPTNLNEICEIIQISVRYPRCTRQVDQKTKILVDEVEIDQANISNPSWRLMPKAMQTELTKVGTVVAKLIAQYCVHFKATNSAGVDSYCRGVYMTPTHTAETLLTELQKADAQIREVVDRHTSDMIQFHRDVRHQMKDDTAFEMAKDKIPTREEMLKTAGVWFASFPIAQNGRGVNVGLMSMMEEARRRADEMLAGLTDPLVNQPRTELAAAIASLFELASNNGRVTQKSLAPVRRALEKLRLFTFVEDPETRGHMEALERQLSQMDTRLLSQDQEAMQSLKTASELFAAPTDIRRRRIGGMAG